jgi:hypothetical protein
MHISFDGSGDIGRSRGHENFLPLLSVRCSLKHTLSGIGVGCRRRQYQLLPPSPAFKHRCMTPQVAAKGK